MSTAMTSFFRTTATMVDRFEQAIRQRRAARTLEGLPDFILKDIGYGRDPVGVPSRMWTDLSR